MADFFNVAHPFFRPAWRRAVAVVLVLGWAFVELSNGAMFWAGLFAAAGAWLGYKFFIAFDPADYARPPKDDDPA